MKPWLIIKVGKEETFIPFTSIIDITFKHSDTIGIVASATVRIAVPGLEPDVIEYGSSIAGALSDISS